MVRSSSRPTTARPPRARRRAATAPAALPVRLNGAGAQGPGEDRKFVLSLARAFELLRVFRPGHGALSNAELSQLASLPKATVTRLTYTLTRLGYLRQGEDGRYAPATALLALAYPVLANIRLRQAAQERMHTLAEHSGASVAIAAPDADAMIYVAASSASSIDALLLDIGSRVSMARSALGRAYMTALDEEAREVLFEHWRRVEGSGWPDLRTRIEASMAEVRERGFCYVDREWREDVRAVAAPIRDAEGRAVMAMNIGGPARLLDAGRLESELGPRLAELAGSLDPTG